MSLSDTLNMLPSSKFDIEFNGRIQYRSFKVFDTTYGISTYIQIHTFLTQNGSKERNFHNINMANLKLHVRDKFYHVNIIRFANQ